MAPTRIPRLNLEDYEHPMETRALEKLKNTKGLSKVVSKFHEMSFEKSIRLQYMSSCLLASDRTYPQLTFLVKKACDVLGVEVVPELYIQRSDSLMSLTVGSEDPIIVLTTELVDKFSSEELLFVIGREVAHIKSNHILFQEIGMILPEIMEAFSVVTLGLTSIVSAGLNYTLLTWKQMAELTADRGGLLVSQDVEVVKRIFAKWSGLPEKDWSSFHVGEFEWQARNLDSLNPKMLDKIVGLILGDVSWAVARMKEILDWVESEGYKKIQSTVGSK